METVTVSEFCKKHNITADFEYVGRGTQAPWDERWECDHWKVKFSIHPLSGAKSRFMTTVFYCGTALNHKQPTAEEVLDCLASAAVGIENAKNYEEWANEYGYDADSRNGEKIYKAILHQTNRLKAFIKNAVSFEKLLFNTERL